MEVILVFIAVFTSLFFASRFHRQGRGSLLGFLYGLFLCPVALVHALVILTRGNRPNSEDAATAVGEMRAGSNSRLDHGLQPLYSMDDLTHAIGLYPNEPRLYKERGLAYLSLSKYEDAVADFTKAIRLDPNDAGLYRERGTGWFGLHRFDAATDDFSAAIGLMPGEPGLFLSRGLSYKNQSMYDRAIQNFNYAIKLNPRDASLYHHLGTCWIELNEYDTAIVSFARAIALDPEAETLAARGDVYFRMGAFDDALKDYERALRLSPNADSYSSRGSTLLELGEHEKALSDFRTALRLDPLRPDIHMKAAIEQLTHGIATLPDYLEANQHELQGPEQEMEAYDVVVSSIAELYSARAMCHFITGDIRRAMEDYDAAIKLNPRDAKSYHGRGGCHTRNQDQDLALKDLNTAIMLTSHGTSSSDRANSYSTRGMIFLNRDDYESALQDFETAIGLEPNHPDAYTGRGACRLHLGKYGKSICDLDTAVELACNPAGGENVGEYMVFHFDPWYPHALRGLAYSMLGCEASYRSDFERATELGAEWAKMKVFLKELVPAWTSKCQ